MTYPLMTDGKTDWDKVATARGLASVFGAEYDALTSEEAAAVIIDCLYGVEDLVEYRRSIGAGNLASYARTQIARFCAVDDGSCLGRVRNGYCVPHTPIDRARDKARAAYEAEARSFGPQITLTTDAD